MVAGGLDRRPMQVVRCPAFYTTWGFVLRWRSRQLVSPWPSPASITLLKCSGPSSAVSFLASSSSSFSVSLFQLRSLGLLLFISFYLTRFLPSDKPLPYPFTHCVQILYLFYCLIIHKVSTAIFITSLYQYLPPVHSLTLCQPFSVIHSMLHYLSWQQHKGLTSLTLTGEHRNGWCCQCFQEHVGISARVSFSSLIDFGVI